MRRKHFALATERSYSAWLRRYCDFIVKLPVHGSSEQKLEQFLTASGLMPDLLQLNRIGMTT